ncbi:MAG: recombinase RecA, partial [Acetobacter sp.]|nr:recombinase RecA [Acetobacter sp.]
AIKKHLTTFGVEESIKKSIFSQEESERLSETDRDLCAALVLARKRKLGPFSSPLLQNFSETGAIFARQKPYVHQKQEQKKRALAVFARAGFVRDIAERVLKMDEGEAWRWLNRMRSES